MRKPALYLSLLVITAVILVIPAIATLAQVQDSGACDELDGPPKGLCYVYCEVMECDSDSISVGAEYCGRVYDKYVEYTGALPPCEEEACSAEATEACGG